MPSDAVKTTDLSPNLKAQIDRMTREDMAHAWRFDPPGSPIFCGDAGDYFESRFKSLGGFSTAISKALGW